MSLRDVVYDVDDGDAVNENEWEEAHYPGFGSILDDDDREDHGGLDFDAKEIMHERLILMPDIKRSEQMEVRWVSLNARVYVMPDGAPPGRTGDGSTSTSRETLTRSAPLTSVKSASPRGELRSVGSYFTGALAVAKRFMATLLGGNSVPSSAHEDGTRAVITNQSGTAVPGRLVALMGPSGCGKTTLLNILAGRRRAMPPFVDGCVEYVSARDGVTLNRIDGATSAGATMKTVTSAAIANVKSAASASAASNAYGRFGIKRIKRKIGFVTQDEVLTETLTVEETMVFSALLKLPHALPRREKLARATVVMEELGLGDVKRTIVGGEDRRGVSGGERKRVSIGIELLTNPSVLYLDEPTSGLDSTIALQLVHTLKMLAKGGRTVITSIHQPSSRCFAAFDDVSLMTRGRCIYNGVADGMIEYFETLGAKIPVGTNVAEFVLDLANDVGDVGVDLLIDRFDSREHWSIGSSANTMTQHSGPGDADDEALDSFDAHAVLCTLDFVDEKPPASVAGRVRGGAADPPDPFLEPSVSAERTWATPFWTQLLVLTRRSFLQRRFEWWDPITLAHYTMTAVMVGLIWFQLGKKEPMTEDYVLDIGGYIFITLTFLTFTVLFSSIFTV